MLALLVVSSICDFLLRHQFIFFSLCGFPSFHQDSINLHILICSIMPSSRCFHILLSSSTCSHQGFSFPQTTCSAIIRSPSQNFLSILCTVSSICLKVCLFLFNFLIEISLIHNLILVSNVQHSR